MSDFDVTSGNWTVCDQKSLSSVNLEDEFTPTAALEFGLDLDCPVGLPELKDDPDMMDRVSHCPAVHDIALKNFEELYDFDNEDSTEESWRQGFDTLASKSDGDAAPGFVYDPNDEACAADAQKQISVRQDAVDPAELSVHAVEGVSYHLDFSDLSPQLDFLDVSYHLDSSDLSVHDLHGPFPGDFEFPDGPSGLDLAQHSQTTVRSGYNSQGLLFSTGNIAIQDYGCRRNSKDGCSDTSLVALELRSEQNSEDASHIELTKPPRQLMSIQRNKQYSQNSAYTPLIEKPTAWDIFEYTKDGELHPSRLLSAKEIHRFLFTHPLHKGHRKLKDSPLKLRVHKTPASSAKRFPNGLFCRFKDCPMRTINQGQLLVIVDELSVQHPDHDLYLNAAYFHLFCIEMFCDFAEIVANLAVTAEGRETRKEPGRKNHFLLSHEEEKVVEDFVDGHGGWVVRCPDQPPTGFCPHFEPQSPPYEGTLCHQLNVTKLHHGDQARINLRKDREAQAGYRGANILHHLGDLNKEAQLREFSRTHKNQKMLKPNPQRSRYYRAERHRVGMKEPADSHSETDRQQSNQLSAVVDPFQFHRAEQCRDEGFDDQELDHGLVSEQKKPRFPGYKIPVWDLRLDQSKKGTNGFENTVGDAPRILPRTVLSPTIQLTGSKPQKTTVTSSFDELLVSTTGEEDSEGEMELAMLAVQRQRRMLEIADAKDREREYELRKLKLQKAQERKRARGEDGYDTESTAKRQKRW